MLWFYNLTTGNNDTAVHWSLLQFCVCACVHAQHFLTGWAIKILKTVLKGFRILLMPRLVPVQFLAASLARKTRLADWSLDVNLLLANVPRDIKIGVMYISNDRQPSGSRQMIWHDILSNNYK